MGELHLFFSQPNLSSLRVSFFSASRSTGGCLLWLQLYIYIHTQGQLVVAYFDCRYMFTPKAAATIPTSKEMKLLLPQ
ncbi:hypothetical protein BS78_K127900 [Paspalum vaginatum]|uniref:Uncharacterized protein n=1 Tax=Paspalum vaginatum TaxID=158149 RepID=A0A9W8CEL7_9POAL|nr:hypothetical protein BS78_K127900 [Paspalum vaginatum]